MILKTVKLTQKYNCIFNNYVLLYKYFRLQCLKKRNNTVILDRRRVPKLLQITGTQTILGEDKEC